MDLCTLPGIEGQAADTRRVFSITYSSGAIRVVREGLWGTERLPLPQ